MTIKRYPKLVSRIASNGGAVLEGEIDLLDAEKKSVDSFKVKMMYTTKFPYAYPKVCEIGGRFPRDHEDMHINGDGTLCLNSEPGEALDTYRGMDTCVFIEKVLLPNLAWRVCKLENIDVDLKEFSHGALGTLESYTTILNVTDPNLVIRILTAYLNKPLPKRNAPCLCGSNKKFKLCHEQATSKLSYIDKKTLSTHLSAISKHVTERYLVSNPHKI